MSWKEYNESLVRYEDLRFSLDLSLMDVKQSEKDPAGRNPDIARKRMQNAFYGKIT